MIGELLSSAAARWRRADSNEVVRVLAEIEQISSGGGDAELARAYQTELAVLRSALDSPPAKSVAKPRPKRVKRSKITATPKGSLSNWQR